MREFNDKENHLISSLGVYGCWILKHGKRLSRKSAVARAYARYLMFGNNAALKLFRVIDFAVKTQGIEDVFKSYEKAVADLRQNG